MSIRKSRFYIWNVHDSLGTGATGRVYKCRKLKDGSMYAAKVLNSKANVSESIDREVEMLKKLSHENIVKFIEIDRMNDEHSIVLIIEMCDRSLHDVIKRPENQFGLSEQMYKNVISDVSAGMEYLRNNNVIHRDVKPGNILQVLNAQNGRYKYKISDFGASRHLMEDEVFESVHGTEEYLHPDIYKKAIMKYHTNGPFNSTVDLWSLGVTFYHLATGILPFKPFRGRQDTHIMNQMLTTKPPGVISCHQHSEGGMLQFSNELPIQTRISAGLKALLTPILRGLLETHPGHMISYDNFFSKIKKIMDMKVISVYTNRKSIIHKIYLEKEQTLPDLKDSIASLTEIKPVEQHLFFNYNEFKPTFNQTIGNYPEILDDNPLIVLSNVIVPSASLERLKVPNILQVGNRMTHENDATHSRYYMESSYRIERDTMIFNNECKAIIKAHEIFRTVTKRMCHHFECTCAEINERSTENYRHIQNISMTFKKLGDMEEGQLANVDENYQRLGAMLNECFIKIKDLFEEDFLNERWKAEFVSIDEIPNTSKLIGFRKIITEINEQFHKDLTKATASSNFDDLAHRFDRRRLSESFEMMRKRLFVSEENRNKLHDAFNSWFSELSKRRNELMGLQDKVHNLFESFQKNYKDYNLQFSQRLDNAAKSLILPLDQYYDELLTLAEDSKKMLASLQLDDDVSLNNS